MDIEKLKQKLLQKAMGYDVEEVSEEYVSEEGELKLSKRKINTKHIPADNVAIKTLLEDFEKDDIDCMDEKQLKEERERLINEIKKELKGG